MWMACDGGLRAAASGTGNGPVHAAIVKKLTEGLEPVSLVVTDNSADHAGHAGNPTGSPSAESHFEVDVVSAKFAGVKPVGRHRLVYELIDAEMKGTSVPGHPGVHALSIKARAPSAVAILPAMILTELDCFLTCETVSRTRRE